MIYDPLETEASRRILLEMLGELGLRREYGLVGGWAVHEMTRDAFLRATGRETPRSRDIDVFIDSSGDFPREFAEVIGRLGFTPGGYGFRYSLILDRETMERIGEEEARGRQSFDLIYVFLDILSNGESDVLGVWPNEIVGRMIDEEALRVIRLDGRQVHAPSADMLLLLKIDSFTKRESREKRLKDACDIYALLFYSEGDVPGRLGASRWKADRARVGIEMMLDEEVLGHIGEALFGDRLKAGLLRRNLSRVIGLLGP